MGTLAVTLQLITLLPRALVLNTRESAISQVREYFDLDVKRSRTGVAILEKHSMQSSDTTLRREMTTIRTSRYPEEDLARNAQALYEQSRIEESRAVSVRLIALNAAEPSGWQHMARCYLKAFEPDSAVQAYRIADALNPYNYDCVYELGTAYHLAGHVNEARHQWYRAIRLDSTRHQAYWLLAQSYRSENPEAFEYGEYLRLAAGKEGATAELLKEAADLLLSQKDYNAASEAYRRALTKGADTSAIRDSVARHPELKGVIEP